MKFSGHTSQRGFTLIEVLTVIFVYTLIMVGASELIRTMFRQSSTRFQSLNSIDQVQFESARFGNEIRNAQTGNDGAFALGQASTSQIIFYSSFGAANTTTVQRIRYYLASSTIYKGVIVPGGNPLAYKMASETVRTLITNVQNGNTPVFYYYDGSYAGTSSPLTQPVNINSVEFVQMNLKIKQQDTRTSTTTYNFVTGASLRSLKTNLGN